MHKSSIDIPRSWALALIVAILLGAAFIRVHDLSNIPPGMAFDVSWDYADALRISRGIPFPAVFDTRSEPVYRWLLAGSFILFGPHTASGLFFQVFVALLTVALTYAAGLAILERRRWPRIGALLAAGALAANTAHVFLVRSPYRSVLVPPVILLTLIVLLRAIRSGQVRLWALGGFIGVLAVHTYLAGIMTPLWVAAFAAYRAIFPLKDRRIRWRPLLWMALGMIAPLTVWLILIERVPDLFFRVHAAGGDLPITPLRVLNGYGGALLEFFVRGYPLPMYNTPYTPFMNPILALLAIIGFLVALWRWRTPESILLISGLILFIIPSALSEDPTHPVRLVGAMPLLALLAGSGAAWLAGRLPHPPTPNQTRGLSPLSPEKGSYAASVWTPPLHKWRGGWGARQTITLLTVSVIVVSIGATHLAYHAMFADPAEYTPPENWLGIPHNYIIALTEALEALEKVDKPTYVPVSVLDSPAAGYILQRSAFPNVTTWARYGLRELPEGQYFFPVIDYYHMPMHNDDPRMALLLPAEKTIVILPCVGGAPIVSEPISAQTRGLTSKYGWQIARISPVPRAEFSLPQFPDRAQTPTMGNGLQLVDQVISGETQPGKATPILLYWWVLAPQPTDIFSVAQLLDLKFGNYGNSDHYVLPYLYPSARWQPGDIIPDWHSVPIAAALPDGVYRWASGVHVPPNPKRLTVAPRNSELDDLWFWSALRRPQPQPSELPAEATPLQVTFDDHLILAGYQLLRDNTSWRVTLYWRVDAPPTGDYTIFIHAMNGAQIVAQQDARPFDGQLPTWSWLPGEVLTTRYTLTIPADATTPNALYVGLYAYPSLERLAVMQNGKTIADRRALIWSAK